jgi:hypothetical protein
MAQRPFTFRNMGRFYRKVLFRTHSVHLLFSKRDFCFTARLPVSSLRFALHSGEAYCVLMPKPVLTKDDLFEGQPDTPSKGCGCSAKKRTGVHECSCSAKKSVEARERIEAIAEPMRSSGTERVEAIAEDKIENQPNVCRPWLRIVKDPQAFRACQDLSQRLGRIETSEKLYEVVKQQMELEDQEVYYVIALDTQLYLRGFSEICRGARDRVMTPIQDTARYALGYAQILGAQGLAIAHCHPSGHPKPSEADKDVTKAVQRMCKANELLFLDHIIVGDGGPDYFSFRDNGYIKD